MGKKKKPALIESTDYGRIFEELKRTVSVIDPVAFAETYLTIDGRAFNLSDAGWRYMAEIYRSVAAQVESKDARPIVLLKGRQVGATVMATVLSLYLAASGLYGTKANKPPIRIMHLFPALKTMTQHAKEKLDPMMNSSADNYILQKNLKHDDDAAMTAEDTITEKYFIGFNKLRIDSIGKTGDRLRGTTQDVLLMDEIQDMSKLAIENVLRVLTTSPYGASTQGVQVYFGTPKQSGSYFWEIWNDSDKRFHQLRCLSCKDYFFLYTLDDEKWFDIWISGHTVKCPTCGTLQDKRNASDNGRWVATNPGAKKIGYHFNILLSPLFTKENIIEYYPKTNPNASERAWRNETLGDFYSGGGVPLTFEDICNNALDDTRGTSKSIDDSKGKIICLGADWGHKEDTDDPAEKNKGKSYSCAVIISADAQGIITVENALRLKKNDLMYQTDTMSKLIEAYKIQQAAADFMWGQQTVMYMQRELQMKDKFLGCQNSGSLLKMVNYRESEYMVMINKNQMIEEIFTMIKLGKIRFPSKGMAFEQLRWLFDHMTSMESGTKVQGGNSVKTFEKGNTPNDGLMALMYAVVAYKFVTTNGFNNRFQDGPKNVKMPAPTLGRIQRW